MKTPNRDLLVLVKDESLTEKAMENEVEQLNRLLLHFETMDTFCQAHEVFDMNRYRIISKPDVIQQLINSVSIKPFVFVSNKN